MLDVSFAMSLDLNSILKDWPHENGSIKVRKVAGLDGREKLQLRVDLGVLQMELTGRPDGRRPVLSSLSEPVSDQRFRRGRARYATQSRPFHVRRRAHRPGGVFLEPAAVPALRAHDEYARQGIHSSRPGKICRGHGRD